MFWVGVLTLCGAEECLELYGACVDQVVFYIFKGRDRPDVVFLHGQCWLASGEAMVLWRAGRRDSGSLKAERCI